MLLLLAAVFSFLVAMILITKISDLTTIQYQLMHGVPKQIM